MLEAAYRKAYQLIPDLCRCPRCGFDKDKGTMERHHPAGRRKHAFLFTFMVCTECHHWAHANPAQAEEQGLLWKGRNSKTFTIEAAKELISRMTHPSQYPLEILIDKSASFL